jgi:hypothetical protein
MPVPTPKRLRSRARRLDRRIRNAETVVTAMKRGAALHLEYVFGSPVFMLTDGRRIEPAVAKAVIARPEIIGVGAALFQGMRPQTLRYAS